MVMELTYSSMADATVGSPHVTKLPGAILNSGGTTLAPKGWRAGSPE